MNMFMSPAVQPIAQPVVFSVGYINLPTFPTTPFPALSLPHHPTAENKSDSGSTGTSPQMVPVVCTQDTTDEPPPLVDTADPCEETHTYVVELRHGRKRIATTDTSFPRGAHVLLFANKGNEIATIKKLIPSRKKVTGSRTRMRVVREVPQEEFDAFVAESEQEEMGALALARNLVEQLGVQLVIHCVSMQQDRSRFTFHYTSSQTHPDFRKLVNDLSSSLRVNVWFNNCSPAPGSPGDKIDPRYMVN